MATRERRSSSRSDSGPRPAALAQGPAAAPDRRPLRARRVRAYVGLGANLGDAAGTLTAGIHALAALPGVRLAGISRLYATKPVGVTDQPEFRNAVVALAVPAGPDPGTGALALLLALKMVERAFGRQARERWGPRELDLDLLVFGRHAIRVQRPAAARSDDPAKPAVQWLQVPHASARERLFVLAPLADLAPGLRPPGWGETVATARNRAEAREGPDAVRPIAAWDARRASWTARAAGVADRRDPAPARQSRPRPA
jgi:2-amino-4-hydroxy-6-hydroxymethyldihydropteridine diphosphokinase